MGCRCVEGIIAAPTIFSVQIDIDQLKITSDECSEVPQPRETGEERPRSGGESAGGLLETKVQEPGQAKARQGHDQGFPEHFSSRDF